jgi:hypothetical protein
MILESPFSSPLRLTVVATKTTVQLIVLPLLFIALSVGFLSQWHWMFSIAIAVVLSLAAFYYLKLHAWQHLAKSVTEFNQDSEGEWSLLCPNLYREKSQSEWVLAELLGNSFVSSWLVVLNFKGEGKRFTVILPADSLDSDTFRRLRVRLRVTFS